MRHIARCLALSLALCLGVPAAARAQDELLINGGVEAGSGTTPLSWTASTWGTNTTAFTWSTDAHGGSRSLRVSVSAYTDGDSKWVPDAVPVTGGRYYTFSDWYKSSAGTAVSVYYETATDPPDGGTWANLFSGIPAASSWTQYRTGFTMPPDAVRAIFVHFIARTGYLQTDDSSVREQEAPPGFDRPMISLTFDDGSQSFHDVALPLLDAKGYRTTQYIPTEQLSAGDEYMMTPAEVKALVTNGHEVGSHSITHPDLTAVSDAQLASELTGSKTVLESIIGRPVTGLAYPFGSYDARVIAAARSAGYTTARSVEDGYTSRADLEAYDLRAQNMLSSTTQPTFQAWVDYAKAHNYWLTVVYHEVVPDAAPACTVPETATPCLGPYDTTVSRFSAQLDYLAASGLGPNVLPVKDAMAEAAPQLHVPAAGRVVLTPDPLSKDAVAAATASGFVDPDGDALTYHYEWTDDGTVVAGATGPALDIGLAGDLRGRTVAVAVYADDGHGNRSRTVGASAPVLNRVPIAGTVRLTPAHPAVGAELRVDASPAADADGDLPTYRYAWYRNGTPLAAADETIGTGGMSPGDVIRVEARADDHHGGVSPAVTDEVTLAGESPRATATPQPTVSPQPTATPPADRLKPAITVSSPRVRAYHRGAKLRLRFSAKDASGITRLTATLRRAGGKARTVRAGTLVRLTRTGRYTLRIRATDRAGNSAVKTIAFRVVR